MKATEKEMEFIPFGAQDKIKLTIAIVQNLIAVKTKSGKTCSDQDAVKFMMMCQARRLNPFEGDAYLIGYDSRDGASFSLITAHQAFLKRAEVNPEYDGMKSGIIIQRDGDVKDVEGDFFLEGDVLLGGWATVYFKNRKQSMHKRVRLKRFQKSWGIWQEDPAGMICKCAEADALRSSFPTMLGGLYLKEELNPVDTPKLTAPLFTTPEKPPIDVGSVEQKPAPEAEPAAPAPEPEPEKPAPAPPHPIKQLRDKLKVAGLKDVDIITFLADVGSIESGMNSLEEVQLKSADSIQMVLAQFDDIAARIKGE